MPLKRTPPSSPLPTESTKQTNRPEQHLQIDVQDSDSISEASGSTRVTKQSARPKTKRDTQCKKCDSDMHSFKAEMRTLISSLSQTVETRFEELKEHNTEMRASLQFMSDQYDALLAKLAVLESEKSKDRKLIMQLEDKIEILERKSKFSGLEIRNVPNSRQDKRSETKQELSALATNLATSVGVRLQQHEIRDIYRTVASKETEKPITVEFCSVIKKEELLSAVKSYNKEKYRQDKLNTEHLKIQGQKKPVFVSETLSFKAQKLYYLAREFSRENSYQFCWTSRGCVYLRKAEKQPLIRVDSEADLEKYKNKD